MKSTGVPAIDHAYSARRFRVDLVEVPELVFLMVDGRGTPEGVAFTSAIAALYSVSYAAHFILKARAGDAPRVMPLEALWWIDDLSDEENYRRFGAQNNTGPVDLTEAGWRLMIAQLPPIDDTIIRQAISQASSKADVGAVTYAPWCEGTCMQILHLGPYSAEAPTIQTLHDAIAARGARPRGRHHEIYLGDPRRSAPERLKTILRQPIEMTSEDGQ